MKCLVIASTFYLLSSYLCRISILCIYYELLRQIPWMGHIILAAGAWVIICGVTSMGVQLGVGIQDVLFVLAGKQLPHFSLTSSNLNISYFFSVTYRTFQAWIGDGLYTCCRSLPSPLHEGSVISAVIADPNFY